MTINELSKQRKILRQALIDGKMFEGFKEVLANLFPSDAHFISELLQNAEDAGASKVQFVLNADSLEVQHDGDKLFNIEDVESITNIGSSTKADDPTSIGKFGIGFKAVFAYTNTPEIESDIFHFRIRDMIVPDTEELLPGALGEGRTRFVFPFDNPKKPLEEATAEIEKSLRELNENTLLFLSNIRRIEYRLPDSTTGSLERKPVKNGENHIEISVVRPGNPESHSIHYLHFTKDVNVKNEDGESKCCRVAVAFGMDQTESGTWKVIPLNPGRVSIYFPLENETSNLRFHLHAPFASIVARNSVRGCPASDELRNHLAELVTEAMHVIRDNGWLNVEFLATLPNTTDNLSPFYLPIQERLIEEFNKEKLTPMKQGGHAPGSECYRGPRALSDLINDNDLATLLGKNCSQPLWIANPQQLNQREDNFLSMLDISQWNVENLIDELDANNDTVIECLRGKSDQWHQQLYAFLGDDDYLCSNLCIVRCNDGEYRIGSECHFPIDDMEYGPQEGETQEKDFHYVVRGVYSSGKNKDQQRKAYEFLEDIGICEVDEAERIKAILRQRYEDPYTIIPPKLHEEDLKRFIALVEKEPDKVSLFDDYRIFKTADLGSFDKGLYHNASIIFLDSPYLETGLKVCYEDDNYWEFVCEGDISPYLSLDYKEADIDLKKLGKFAEALGAKTRLEAKRQIIPEDHPEWSRHLDQGSGHWRDDTGIDEDYRLPEFQILLANPSLDKAKLFWQAMYSLPEYCLKAQFRWNRSNPLNEGHSTLVHELKNSKWVPQKNGNSISFLRPWDAVRDNLPGGFPYDTGQKWLELIEFGKTVKQQRLENIHKAVEQNSWNQRAREFGFGTEDEAKKAAAFFKEQGKTPEELLKKLHTQKRRKELLIIDLDDAEEKSYEVLARSVKVTGNTIDPRTALRAQYTTDENRMHCQMCSKSMPFKKRNSDEDYFEAVEALGKGYFFKEHEAQYLALCPECAAKYTEFVKRDRKARDAFYNALKNSDNPQIHLESNGETIRIWFEDKHWQDLKTVVCYYENVYDHDESD